ncbi:hypothetical protein [Sinorhizobium meliloti]|uniref:hypothetical protein n=1 Tax=Rhizobium meliloti TaxID=382 RepID=UPI0013E3586E|nr:hypothetical protein [Sinorhizobium meliloti]
MTDRPILFSGPMIRALLAGRKTQTRRLLKPQPPEWATSCQQPTMLNALHQWVPSGLWAWSEEEQSPPRPLRRWPVNADGEHYWLRPRFSIGDRLWVRETWAPLTYLTHNDPGPQAIIDGGFYRADGGTVDGEVSRWKPSIFMPRHASRLTLIVTDVRVERLQDISEADAIAEGAKQYSSSTKLSRPFNADWKGIYREGYAELWNDINGAGSWEANPWVAAYTFTVIKQNIDQIEKVAA